MIFNVQTHNIIQNIKKELQNVKKKKRNILVFSRLYTDSNSTSMLQGPWHKIQEEVGTQNAVNVSVSIK